MEQRSKEWYEARKGKLTGSNIGAALGINNYKAPDDLIRQMVRDYHDAEPEFTGNIATEYGTNYEALAAVEYLGATGLMAEECGFFVHPEHDWLGASPDGLIEDDGVLEIKCPFSKRDDKKLSFLSVEDQPHYHAQMQIEMACTGRNWCHFFQWNKYGYKLVTVDFNQEWFDENLPVLEAFYKKYLSELDNPEHLEPKRVDVKSPEASLLIEEYQSLSSSIKAATERKNAVLDQLVKIAKSKNAVIDGHKLTRIVTGKHPPA